MTTENSPSKRSTAASKAASGEKTAAGPAKTTTARKSATAASAEKVPASKVVAKPVATAESPAPARRRAPASKKSSLLPSGEERYRMVQSAAYFLAERDGFQGSSVDYWVRAEREIAVQLGEVES